MVNLMVFILTYVGLYMHAATGSDNVLTTPYRTSL